MDAKKIQDFLINHWNIILIVLMGLIYIFVIPSKPVVLSIAFKIIPMMLILYYGWTRRPNKFKKYEWLILIGLFICMLGDAFLIWFVLGLGLFLIGHLFYSAAFYEKAEFSWWGFAVILPILAYDLFIGNQLIVALLNRGQDELLVPVIVYIIVISIMLWLSIMTGNLWAVFGAILFVTSDSVLAWNKFVEDIRFSGEIIMLTYYTAQFLIMKSMNETNFKIPKLPKRFNRNKIEAS